MRIRSKIFTGLILVTTILSLLLLSPFNRHKTRNTPRQSSFNADIHITKQLPQDEIILSAMQWLFYEPNNTARPKEDVYAHAIRNYGAQEVMLLTGDDMRISCLYFKRPNAKINLIYISGYFFDQTPTKEWAAPFSVIFEDYNILSLDWRGFGQSDGVQGLFRKSSFGSNAYPDIQAAVDFMHRENDNPTILIGFCFGAAMIMHATIQAQKDGKRTADALVLNCVFSKFQNPFDRAILAETRLLYQILLQTGTARALIDYQCYGDIFSISPIDLIKDIKIPCYFEHYSHDQFAILQEGIDVYNAATCPKMFMQSDLGGHVRIHKRVPYQYQQAFLAFLQKFNFLEPAVP